MLEVSMKPVQKIGSKIFVVRQVVEKSHTMLVELPEKEKSLFELPEAVSVLYPDISEAFQKNQQFPTFEAEERNRSVKCGKMKVPKTFSQRSDSHKLIVYQRNRYFQALGEILSLVCDIVTR